MNWGYKIAIFYTAFALFIIALVVMSFNQKYDLVTEDYYDKELKFQEQIDKQNLVNANSKQIVWKHAGKSLNLVFPATEKVSGEIKLFRPSDAAMDIIVAVMPDSSGNQQIDITAAGSGKYLLQIDWKENDKSYFQESVIIL
jgi:hypothetical protein